MRGPSRDSRDGVGWGMFKSASASSKSIVPIVCPRSDEVKPLLGCKWHYDVRI